MSEIIQLEGMTSELRNSIWNVLDVQLWSSERFLSSQYGQPGMHWFARSLWNSYFKEPLDRIPDTTRRTLEHIRKYFFECAWFEVYDLIEFIVDQYSSDREKSNLSAWLNSVLEREMSGYRFVSGSLTDITGPEELGMLEEALRDNRFSGVAAHLQRSLELYADRENPDYRNSIKESVSAVEAMARLVAANQKATLGDALKAIEKRGSLHSALKDGFLKLYGYTSDEGGIRHSMLDEPVLTAADARYFLLSCTSFSNYLKAQLTP